LQAILLLLLLLLLLLTKAHVQTQSRGEKAGL